MVLQSLNLVNNVANIKFKMCKGTILTHKYLKILLKRNKNSNQFKYIRNKTAYHWIDIILPIHMPIQLTFLIKNNILSFLKFSYQLCLFDIK